MACDREDISFKTYHKQYMRVSGTHGKDTVCSEKGKNGKVE